MITLEEIMNRIEELIDDPAHWHNDTENQKKELEDMIKEYASQEKASNDLPATI
jgi:hypothetical protein